jgi:Tfp pilus assembly ATPase PilU
MNNLYLKTAYAVVKIAYSGHQVMATLHAGSAQQAIEIKNLKTNFLRHIDRLNCKFVTVL